MNIKSAFSQIRIVDFTQSTGVPIGNFGEDKLDVELFYLEVAEHFINQSTIFDDQKVRVEYAGILCSDRFGDPLLHLKDLRPGRDQGCFEAGNLPCNLRIIDRSFRWLFVVGVVEKHYPSSTPRSNADPVKSHFLTAHSGLIPHLSVSQSAVQVPEGLFRHRLLPPKESA